MKYAITAILFIVLITTIFAMDLVGNYSGFTNAQKCFPNGDYLYLLDRFTMFVFDISTPSSPVKVDSITTSGYVLDLALDGDYAFLGSGNSIVVLDMSEPAHPVRIGSTSFGTSDYAYGVAYKDGYIYASIMNYFKILSFTAPSTFSEVYSSAYMTKTVDVENNYAAIGISSGGGGGGMFVFDISEPEIPLGIGGMSTPGYAVDVNIDGDRIYIADGAEVGVGTGHVLMMLTSDLHSEASRFSSDDGDCQHGCAYGEQYVVANGTDGFLLLDWSEPAPTAPTIVDNYSLSAGEYAQDVSVQFPYIYAITRNELLVLSSDDLIDTAGTVDTVDTIPPVVDIIEPTDSLISSCPNQSIILTISDDGSGVNWESVRLLIDGFDFATVVRHGDTIAYTPMSGWTDGDTIHYSLISAMDNDSNSAEGLPITGMFITDFSPPVISLISPAEWETVATDTPTISAIIIDEISGVNDDEITLTVAGTPITDFDWDDSTITYTPAEPLVDTIVSVCISAKDYAQYCGPNSNDTCWFFVIHIDKISEIIKPNETSLSISPNPFNSSCAISINLPSQQDGNLIVEDISGKFVQNLYSGSAQNINIIWKPKMLTSGIYKIIWLGDNIVAQKVLLLK